jgi:hypothetical protein
MSGKGTQRAFVQQVKDYLAHFDHLVLRTSRNTGGDFHTANLKTGRKFPRWTQVGPGITPARGNYNFNWTWHHHEVVGIMQLVPNVVHAGKYHDGGVLFWELAYNKEYLN